MGVESLKIEGRLKDADYVTNVTAYYRELLDAMFPHTEHFYRRTFSPNPEKTFHRGGIDYFLHGRTPHMANWETPKSTGEYIGEVIGIQGNRLRVRLQEGIELHNGDGLAMGEEGFNVNGIEGDTIFINKHLPPMRSHVPLYRNLDTHFVKSLHSERRIPIDIIFRETEEGFYLRMGAAEGYFTYDKEPARNAEKAIETIETQLSKLGDSIYIAREVKVDSKPYFIPIRVLNEWRRQVINSL